jgi:hypothetical protein
MQVQSFALIVVVALHCGTALVCGELVSNSTIEQVGTRYTATVTVKVLPGFDWSKAISFRDCTFLDGLEVNVNPDLAVLYPTFELVNSTITGALSLWGKWRHVLVRNCTFVSTRVTLTHHTFGGPSFSLTLEDNNFAGDVFLSSTSSSPAPAFLSVVGNRFNAGRCSVEVLWSESGQLNARGNWFASGGIKISGDAVNTGFTVEDNHMVEGGQLLELAFGTWIDSTLTMARNEASSSSWTGSEFIFFAIAVPNDSAFTAIIRDNAVHAPQWPGAVFFRMATRGNASIRERWTFENNTVNSTATFNGNPPVYVDIRHPLSGYALSHLLEGVDSPSLQGLLTADLAMDPLRLRRGVSLARLEISFVNRSACTNVTRQNVDLRHVTASLLALRNLRCAGAVRVSRSSLDRLVVNQVNTVGSALSLSENVFNSTGDASIEITFSTFAASRFDMVSNKFLRNTTTSYAAVKLDFVTLQDSLLSLTMNRFSIVQRDPGIYVTANAFVASSCDLIDRSTIVVQRNDFHMVDSSAKNAVLVFDRGSKSFSDAARMYVTNNTLRTSQGDSTGIFITVATAMSCSFVSALLDGLTTGIGGRIFMGGDAQLSCALSNFAFGGDFVVYANTNIEGTSSAKFALINATVKSIYAQLSVAHTHVAFDGVNVTTGAATVSISNGRGCVGLAVEKSSFAGDVTFEVGGAMSPRVHATIRSSTFTASTLQGFKLSLPRGLTPWNIHLHVQSSVFHGTTTGANALVVDNADALIRDTGIYVINSTFFGIGAALRFDKCQVNAETRLRVRQAALDLRPTSTTGIFRLPAVVSMVGCAFVGAESAYEFADPVNPLPDGSWFALKALADGRAALLKFTSAILGSTASAKLDTVLQLQEASGFGLEARCSGFQPGQVDAAQWDSSKYVFASKTVTDSVCTSCTDADCRVAPLAQCNGTMAAGGAGGDGSSCCPCRCDGVPLRTADSQLPCSVPVSYEVPALPPFVPAGLPRFLDPTPTLVWRTATLSRQQAATRARTSTLGSSSRTLWADQTIVETARAPSTEQETSASTVASAAANFTPRASPWATSPPTDAPNKAQNASHTHTRTGSRSPRLPLLRLQPSHLLTTSRRSHADTASVLDAAVGMGDASSTAVVATASASAVLVSIAAPVAAARVTSVGAAMRLAVCLNEFAPPVDDEPRPTLIEMPFPLAIGSSRLRFLTGPLLLTTTITGALASVHTGAFWWRVVPESAVKTVTRAALPAWFGYFGPTTVAYSTTVLVARTADASAVDLVVAVFAMVLHVSVMAGLGYFIVAVVPRYVSAVHGSRPRKLTLSNTSAVPASNKDFVRCYGSLFDATRSLDSTACRSYYVIETATASTICALTGLQPLPGTTCTVVGAGVVIVSAGAFVYAVAVRPYRTRLDTAFSLLFATCNMMLAVAMVIAPRWKFGLMLAGWAVIVVSLGFFANAVVAAAWSIVHSRRNRTAEENEPVNTALLNVPIVTHGNYLPGDTPHDLGAAPTAAFNPLDEPQHVRSHRE